MINDPIVEEVRQARKYLEKKYGPDAESYLKYIYKEQKRLKARLVSRPAVRVSTRKAA